MNTLDYESRGGGLIIAADGALHLYVYTFEHFTFEHFYIYTFEHFTFAHYSVQLPTLYRLLPLPPNR